MPQLTINLTPTEAQALRELSKVECRKYQEQARYLLRIKMIEIGILPKSKVPGIPPERKQDD